MAREKKDGEGAEQEQHGKPALLENKVILLGVMVAVQALLAVALTHFVIVPRLGIQSAAAGAPAVTTVGEEAATGVLVDLREIIVTLQSDTKLPRYLRANVNVEVASQSVADLAVTRLPQLRDTAIMILSARTPAEIQSPEGKQALRDELFRRLSEKLPQGTLSNVYFSDLVIQ
ncbi:MAG: flagellar basal body-associated FliL family protein [Candidatus Krumholzibacteriia bacterium]